MTLHLTELEMQLLLEGNSKSVDIYEFVKSRVAGNRVVVMHIQRLGSDTALIALSSYGTLLLEQSDSSEIVIQSGKGYMLEKLLTMCHSLTIGPENYSDCKYLLSGVDANVSLLIKRTTEQLLAKHNKPQALLSSPAKPNPIDVTTRANIKVAARRLSVDEPTDEQCISVWNRLGLSGIGRRSVLAPVVYKDSLEHGDEDALVIAHIVSEAWVCIDRNTNGQQPVLNELEVIAKRLYGNRGPDFPTYSFAYMAAATYTQYERACSTDKFRNKMGVGVTILRVVQED